MSIALENHIKKTTRHREAVGRLMVTLSVKLIERAYAHDNSKLEEPECSIFAKYATMLDEAEFGSPEYEKVKSALGKAVDYHYDVNRHHPEHFVNGIKGMTLVDVVEMVCDWIDAAERDPTGDINKSIEIGRKRFNISEDLISIIKNTVKEMI